MKKIILILSLCLLLCGCNNSEKINYANPSEEQVEKIMAENEYVIIDVRTKEEYDESHIVDSINIAYDEINDNIDIDKSTIIFVYCKSGNRSKIAFEKLNELGYTTYDLGAFSEISLPKE